MSRNVARMEGNIYRILVVKSEERYRSEYQDING
jgi:hypothetical protein